MLLDLEQPWKVVARARQYLLSPQKDYERHGDVDNVCFACGVLPDYDNDTVRIYYGGARHLYVPGHRRNQRPDRFRQERISVRAERSYHLDSSNVTADNLAQLASHIFIHQACTLPLHSASGRSGRRGT